MKASNTPLLPKGENLALVMHTVLSNSVVNFRNRACEECKWSTPTFYRKLRTKDAKDKYGKVIPALSNAEKEKLNSLFDAEVQKLRDWYSKYVEKRL